MFYPCGFWLETRVIIKIDPSLLTNKLWHVFKRIKQKNFLNFFFQNCRLKKVRFSKSPILKIYFRKFHGLVVGLVGWDTSMPFASINSTNPRTNTWNIQKKNLKIGDFEKRTFFQSAILKTRQSLLVSKDGSKFWWLPWFPAKNHMDKTFLSRVYERI